MADGDKNADTNELNKIRERINAVDEKIQNLINERAQYVV